MKLLWLDDNVFNAHSQLQLSVLLLLKQKEQLHPFAIRLRQSDVRVVLIRRV